LQEGAPYMTDSQIASNPFAMILDPQAVMRALEESEERLSRLRRRVYRPLDRPAAVQVPGDSRQNGRVAPIPEEHD